MLLSSGSPEFYVIAGPTAVGKSEIAVAFAERCGGEIVGADAFQIYQGLDRLTAKPSIELRARVPHHLIGEIPLGQAFDVAQYLVLATRRIAEIRARGRLPIVSGGTGLYLRALTCGLADLPPADAELRAKLGRRTLIELQQQYSALDPEGFAQIDRQNSRRLVRAIEVCLLTGLPFSSIRERWREPTVSFRGIACERPRPELHARINERTERMFRDGVEDEVRTCGLVGPTASQTLGLDQVRKLLRGELEREDCIAAIQQATRQYAKRQMTWLRRETRLTPVDLSSVDDSDLLIERLAREIGA
jgi:tRNA dimethylallyltransferase